MPLLFKPGGRATTAAVHPPSDQFSFPEHPDRLDLDERRRRASARDPQLVVEAERVRAARGVDTPRASTFGAGVDNAMTSTHEELTVLQAQRLTAPWSTLATSSRLPVRSTARTSSSIKGAGDLREEREVGGAGLRGGDQHS